MLPRLLCSLVVALSFCGASALHAETSFDADTRAQAAVERRQMAAGEKFTLTPAMEEFLGTLRRVEYPSGERMLPGYLFVPAGKGPFPAVIWNHGSEREPGARPELARFYTGQGFVFFAPVRHGHGAAPGPYILDVQDEVKVRESDPAVIDRKVVELLEEHNADVVAALAWLKSQPFVDAERIVMSGGSYGGIQTILTAEKGLGIRAFVPFAAAAMSWSNAALRDRLTRAAAGAKAPLLLIQAANDFSTGPAEGLGPLLEKRRDGSRSKIYPAFGSTALDGHAAFGGRSAGIMLWGDDVMQFVAAAFKADSDSSPEDKSSTDGKQSSDAAPQDEAASPSEQPSTVIYRNDFQAEEVQPLTEWQILGTTIFKTQTQQGSCLPGEQPQIVVSASGKERFLGEFGGAAVGNPGDADWNRTRVDQTVSLRLADLSPHRHLRIAFDLYILKSWDGVSPQYGPDRFELRCGEHKLLDATFSNNFKIKQDGSLQSYPAQTDAGKTNPPQTGAAASATLGYTFFKDSTYRLDYTVAHTDATAEFVFMSSLFEGKGVADESWGIDNIVVYSDGVATADDAPKPTPSAAPAEHTETP